MTTQTQVRSTEEALKLALEALKPRAGMPEPEYESLVNCAITAIKEALAQQSNEQVDKQTVTVLPDGSAFAIASYPLPETHWLYAKREYADGEYEPIELGKPILTHEVRDAVISAVRYAVRGATMCGKESDFDPDALVQNAVYALCGPYTPVAHPPVPTAQPKEPEQEPVAWIDKFGNTTFNKERGITPLYTTPPQRKPLTREQRIQIVKDNTVQGYHGDYFDAWGIIDDVEAAHGIGEKK